MRASELYDGADPVNIATGREITIRELATTVANVTGFRGEIEFDASLPNGQPRLRDTSRAEREFGFRAQTDFATGLRQTVGWYEKGSRPQVALPGSQPVQASSLAWRARAHPDSSACHFANAERLLER